MLRRAFRPRNLVILGGSIIGGGYIIENTDNAISQAGIVRFARVGIVVCRLQLCLLHLLVLYRPHR